MILTYLTYKIKGASKMSKKQDRLEQLKKYRGVPNLEYGMYAECNNEYHGYLTYIDGAKVYLTNGIEKRIPCHPTWEMVYYDNPIDKNIIHDFRRSK